MRRQQIRQLIATLMRRLLLYIYAPALLPSGQGYAAKVRPVLQAHCFSCHGEDKQMEKLRLGTLSTGLQGDSALNLIDSKFTMLDEQFSPSIPDEQLSPLSLTQSQPYHNHEKRIQPTIL